MKDLTEARFIRRYKRFLADVRLTDGTVLTVHCPNTGSMKNCADVDQLVWLSMSDSPKRKYKYTWEYIRTGRGHMIGVNTGFANNLVLEAIREGRIIELSCYEKFFREVRYGKENSRIDLLLRSSNRIDCYVEVKSVTLLEEPASKGIGYFPDAVSARGAKHLRELELVAVTGYRAVLFFCIGNI